MSTKTAYADRLSAEEFAERTKNLSPEDRERWRIEEATGPLFDMWLRFEDVFANRAIDRLDVTDADAEVAAQRMEDGGTKEGAAFAYLLRRISTQRIKRELFHKVEAVWAAAGECEAMSIPEVHERYAKLPKGEA